MKGKKKKLEYLDESSLMRISDDSLTVVFQFVSNKFSFGFSCKRMLFLLKNSPQIFFRILDVQYDLNLNPFELLSDESLEKALSSVNLINVTSLRIFNGSKRLFFVVKDLKDTDKKLDFMNLTQSKLSIESLKIISKYCPNLELLDLRGTELSFEDKPSSFLRLKLVNDLNHASEFDTASLSVIISNRIDYIKKKLMSQNRTATRFWVEKFDEEKEKREGRYHGALWLEDGELDTICKDKFKEFIDLVNGVHFFLQMGFWEMMEKNEFSKMFPKLKKFFFTEFNKFQLESRDVRKLLGEGVIVNEETCIECKKKFTNGSCDKLSLCLKCNGYVCVDCKKVEGNNNRKCVLCERLSCKKCYENSCTLFSGESGNSRFCCFCVSAKCHCCSRIETKKSLLKRMCAFEGCQNLSCKSCSKKCGSYYCRSRHKEIYYCQNHKENLLECGCGLRCKLCCTSTCKVCKKNMCAQCVSRTQCSSCGTAPVKTVTMEEVLERTCKNCTKKCSVCIEVRCTDCENSYVPFCCHLKPKTNEPLYNIDLDFQIFGRNTKQVCSDCIVGQCNSCKVGLCQKCEDFNCITCKKSICRDCGFKFSNRCAVCMGISPNNEEKKYKCKQCGEPFPRDKKIFCICEDPKMEELAYCPKCLFKCEKCEKYTCEEEDCMTVCISCKSRICFYCRSNCILKKCENVRPFCKECKKEFGICQDCLPKIRNHVSKWDSLQNKDGKK